MKKDLLTGELFKPKRTNQKYKTAQNRIKFNNLKAKERRDKMHLLNKPLKDSFSALNELMKNNVEAIFHKEFLKGKGVSFEFFTNYEKIEGRFCHCIFNFILVPNENDQIKVIKK